MVNILRFDCAVQRLVKQTRKVVLQLRAAKVLEDLPPLWRAVEAAEVWLELVGEDLEGGGLADAVCANEPEHLAWAGRGQAVQLEGVWPVAVGGVLVEVLWQVDDVERLYSHEHTR